MSKLFKLQDVVLDVLRQFEETRKDDYILALKVFENYINTDLPIETVFKYHKELGLPSLHSIVRIRRKLQVQHPELVDESARKIRAKEEQAYKEYALTNTD